MTPSPSPIHPSAPDLTAIETARRTLRKAMPVTKRWAYFDHAAVAPISQPAATAMERWLAEATCDGDTAWPRWAKGLQSTRLSAARLLGADVDEIALVANTTTGINLVVDGYDWQPGDNVVILADEFPSNAYPWLNLAQRGVETRRLPTRQGEVDLQQLDALCDAQTKIVSISWIAFASGCRRDLTAISQLVHDRGILLFVDAIQGIGAFPLNVQEIEIDFLAADGHKWQLGPEGAGFAYIRRERLPQLRPHGVGWHSVAHAADFSRIELNFKPSAARFEGGSHNMAGFIGWGASLDLLLSVGIPNVAAAILDVTDQACEGLRELGAEILSPRKGEQRSGIVTFDCPGQDAMALRSQCLEQGVVLSCRGGHLRISPHAYNNGEDLQRLFTALKS